MTEEQKEVTDLISVGAQSIVDNANALGLTWTLRPGTVTSVSDVLPLVIYDGDTVPIGVQSLIGGLTVGDRVMLLRIPPGGNYVLGLLTNMSTSLPRGRRDYVASAGSGAIGAETVVLTGNTFTWKAGRAYRYDVTADVTLSVANAGNAQIVRVRQDTIAGSVKRVWVQRCVAVGTESVHFSKVLVRASGSDLDAKLVVTGNGLTNTAIFSPLEMEIFDIGAAADFPGADTI